MTDISIPALLDELDRLYPAAVESKEEDDEADFYGAVATHYPRLAAELRLVRNVCTVLEHGQPRSELIDDVIDALDIWRAAQEAQ